MMKHRIPLIFTAFILTLLCSCASILNSKRTSLMVLTNTPANLVLNKDTLKKVSIGKPFWVNRDKKPLLITVYNDSLTKTVNVKSINSFEYWLNAAPIILGTGFLMDKKTKKRYAYPNTVYIDLSAKDSSYLTYQPLSKYYAQYANVIKFTPLKISGLTNASIELSYERKTGANLSTQIMASYLLPTDLMNIGEDFKQNTKGFRVSLEERFYLKKTAPFGSYIGVEFDYLKSKYNYAGNFKTAETDYYSPDYSDTVGINKQNYSFNLKFGYQKFIGRFSFDVYAGLGLRYKDVKHLDRINPKDEMSKPIEPKIDYITNAEGKRWGLSVPLNVRIGLLF